MYWQYPRNFAAFRIQQLMRYSWKVSYAEVFKFFREITFVVYINSAYTLIKP